MNDQERRLLEDLRYTQTASLTSEQIYPYWENVFAIIIGAFFYLYFQQDERGNMIMISLVALLFSAGWFLLASRNHRFADARFERQRILEEALYNQIPQPERDVTLQGRTIGLFRLYQFIGHEFGPAGNDENLRWNEKLPTWTIRKSLPGALALVWCFLLLYASPLFR